MRYVVSAGGQDKTTAVNAAKASDALAKAERHWGEAECYTVRRISDVDASGGDEAAPAARGWVAGLLGWFR